MKDNKLLLILWAIVVVEMIWAFVRLEQIRDVEAAENRIVIEKSVKVPEAQAENVEQGEVKTINIEIQPKMELSDADKILIAKVVRREAGSEDFIGKCLVVDTVLNRVLSPSFPNTVSGVIQGAYAKPAGSYTAEDMQAVEVQLVNRLDSRVIYFRTKRFHGFGTPLYQYGAHYFSAEGGAK